MAQVTIGGDRLGAGKKEKVHLKNYERSTHDLSYAWRSTMAAGTLVPFINEIGLPGDSFDIDLNCSVMTHPTIGPLFGSYKVQIDVFQVPIRLYNAKLHMNMLGIGMKMNQIKLPQQELEVEPLDVDKIKELIENGNYENTQINPSCLLSYLNIRGVGRNTTDEIQTRQFNAIPNLAYWDIYKNYYANKQEEVGMVIHTAVSEQGHVEIQNGVMNVEVDATTNNSIEMSDPSNPSTNELTMGGTYPRVTFAIIGGTLTQAQEYVNNVIIDLGGNPIPQGITIYPTYHQGVKLIDIFQTVTVNDQGGQYVVTANNSSWEYDTGTQAPWQGRFYGYTTLEEIEVAEGLIKIKEFPLKNIDDMRIKILQHVGEEAFIINKELTTLTPYRWLYDTDVYDFKTTYSRQHTQEGLGLKTYQSDLFNNWISTEWIDGENGINDITAISTTEDFITIDQINLSSKIYDMLNRIAISGGSYDDWLDATYTHERTKSVENPIYMGGMSQELVFEEVISQSDTEENPLGTLAGRGVLDNKRKGGQVKIKVDEPSLIMGIISLTPRIDYSQGNKWDTNLKTMDDFHKPALDEIGFQDLITEQMAWWETTIGEDGELTQKSAGKQPAWINYMTNVNQVRGNFADPHQQMWMTLNRKYEADEELGIKDLTTYVDPSKFNHIFADTRLDAQNFWTQIGVGMKVRRKMSAKVMPNL